MKENFQDFADLIKLLAPHLDFYSAKGYSVKVSTGTGGNPNSIQVYMNHGEIFIGLDIVPYLEVAQVVISASSTVVNEFFKLRTPWETPFAEMKADVELSVAELFDHVAVSLALVLSKTS